jgi:hypothetical protein
MIAICLLAALLSPPGYAGQSELALIVVNERSSPGDPVMVEALTLDDGNPTNEQAPMLLIDGTAAETLTSLGRGRWGATFGSIQPDGGEIEARWRAQTARIDIPAAAFPGTAITGPTSIKAHTGRSVRVPIRAVLGGNLDIGQVQVAARYGRSIVEISDDGLPQINFHPGDSPYPRSIPLIVQHAAHLRSRPHIVYVQISAHPTIPVQTEAGAEVSMTVAGEAYGPVTAGPSGTVSFQVTVPPGTDKADVSLKDPLGNQQTSTILLGGSTGPQITLAHIGGLIDGGTPPSVYMAAATARGTPWTGHAPSCTGLSQTKLVTVQPGLWRASVPSSGSSDQRIECRLPGGQTSELVVPIERNRATRLVLQAYPAELSTDIPVAELQAYLLNGVGERLSPDEIALGAEFGTVVLDQPDGRAVVRARYDGTAAARHGEDLLRASWKRPIGTGGVWDMAVRAAAPGSGDEALFDVRTVDQGGRPLPNVRVQMDNGTERFTATTGQYGWASATFAWPKGRSHMALEAQADGLTRRSFVTRGTRPGPAAGTPDLLTEVLVPIRPGRVHGVVLNIQPRTLTNDGMVGRLEVHLEDKSGNRVTGQRVDLSASTGTVGPVTIGPNGTYVAQYAPHVGMPPGRVRLTASTSDGRFSAATDVEIIPRRVDWSIGLHGGYLLGASRLYAPTLGLSFEYRMPVETLYLRVDGLMYSVSVEDRDPKTGLNLSMQTTVVPIGVGAVVRRGLGRFPAWLGGEAVLAPYSLKASFDGVTASDGSGWMSPGAAFLGGVGWRTGPGELYVEGRYMLLSAPGKTLGWVGAMGGMVGSIGYKLLY